MENLHGCKFRLIFSIIICLSFGLVSFLFCIIAETKRNKKKDLKMDGKLCYLPESHAFGFGVAALVCLFVAQIIGNSVVFRNSFSGGKRRGSQAKLSEIVKALLSISWISFGVAVVLVSTATSMSRKQPYGKGWLDGECYLVKQEIYIGSSILILVTTSSTVGSAITTIRESQS
ncbi:Chitin synthase, putative (DUF1218) [Quillaja saponaria]|uniref:Chitin synthase, putative (DUF1218) n=1 Tax=Quillaja saponaria TaxID=32244 RepID=A0AAD7KQR6_QUISA|nr:Chitin synthase, putative (DUF1218) [Quillaja saponaria]